MTSPTPAVAFPYRSSRHVLPVLALSAALIGTLTGCSQSADPRPTPPAAAATTPSTAAPTGGAIGSPSPAGPSAAVPPPLDDNGPTDAGRAARPAGDSAVQARTRAVAFLRAFARTDLAQQQWWDGIVGFFTPTAAAAYQGTDVANVPIHKVSETGAKVLADSTRYRAQVKVKTDAGTYTVILVRAGGDWLVDRAVPPRSVGS